MGHDPSLYSSESSDRSRDDFASAIWGHPTPTSTQEETRGCMESLKRHDTPPVLPAPFLVLYMNCGDSISKQQMTRSSALSAAMKRAMTAKRKKETPKHPALQGKPQRDQAPLAGGRGPLGWLCIPAASQTRLQNPTALNFPHSSPQPWGWRVTRASKEKATRLCL